MTATDRIAIKKDGRAQLAQVTGRPLQFRTVGQQTELTLVPLNQIFDERYAVYWKIENRGT